MWLDALALLLLGFFVGMGALRGTLASALSLGTLALGYGGALWLGPRIAPDLAEFAGLGRTAALVVAGSGVFFAVLLLGALLRRALRRRERRAGGAPRSAPDRVFGGALGGLRGLLLVLLVSYLALWSEPLAGIGSGPAVPALEDSTAAALTERLVETGVHAAMGDAGPGGRMAARLAARPGRRLLELQQVLDHEALEAVRADGLFWTYLEHGNVDVAMNRVSFRRLARDDGLRATLADLGLVSEGAAADAGVFHEELRDTLAQVGVRIRRLRHDPELQRLMEDPQVVAAMEQGDHLTLMRDPRFRSVVARALEGAPGS